MGVKIHLPGSIGIYRGARESRAITIGCYRAQAKRIDGIADGIEAPRWISESRYRHEYRQADTKP